VSTFTDNRDVKAVADTRGCTVVRPEPNELLLDLDTDAQFQQFLNMRPLLEERYKVCSVRGWLSSHGRRHIVVTLNKDLGSSERILLQAVLGSDPKREFLSYMRVKDAAPDPTVLFRPKWPTDYAPAFD
jgi:hypothetical protein